jgi:hypothetical protein
VDVLDVAADEDVMLTSGDRDGVAVMDPEYGALASEAVFGPVVAVGEMVVGYRTGSAVAGLKRDAISRHRLQEIWYIEVSLSPHSVDVPQDPLLAPQRS